MSHSGKINHDTTEPNSKAVILSTVAFFVALLIIMYGAYLYYRGTSSSEQTKKEMTKAPYEVQTNRLYENEMLNSFKWINQKKGLIQIPIEEAMQLTVEDYN